MSRKPADKIQGNCHDDDNRREWIEERAGILEYDAGLPRPDAERLAREQWARYDLDRRSR
jgi:hypothetical protein